MVYANFILMQVPILHPFMVQFFNPFGHMPHWDICPKFTSCMFQRFFICAEIFAQICDYLYALLVQVKELEKWIL